MQYRERPLIEDNLIQNEEKKKSIYREIFIKANNEFLAKFNAHKCKLSCKTCEKYAPNCSNLPQNPTQALPRYCVFKFWQEKCLNLLQNDISQSLAKQISQINTLKEKYSCNRCAACCKLASSEYSYEQLKERAQNGDIFSQQFISVFIPYENYENARENYPEFFDLLKHKYQNDEEIYFYHCPKITKDNLCSDYENRPDICRDFPNNPLVIFPKGCGFRKWQDEVDIEALTTHALVEITNFYIEKIKKALQD